MSNKFILSDHNSSVFLLSVLSLALRAKLTPDSVSCCPAAVTPQRARTRRPQPVEVTRCILLGNAPRLRSAASKCAAIKICSGLVLSPDVLQMEDFYFLPHQPERNLRSLASFMLLSGVDIFFPSNLVP